MTSTALLADSQWEFALAADQRPWLAYYSAETELQLRAPDGAAAHFERADGSSAPSGLALTALEAGAALLWRDKVPTKGLHLAVTGPGASVHEVGCRY